MTKILITGGYGFIGSHLVRALSQTHESAELAIFDAMTYAARPKYLNDYFHKKKCKPEHFYANLNDAEITENVIKQFKPDVIFHLAAESHVCRSIAGPKSFVDSNIVGTFNLLEAIRKHAPTARLIHISTDEVFGAIKLQSEEKFTISSKPNPTSPYSGTKAASEMLTQAWAHTYNLDTVITNCSNNYGPNQHEEKLIPRTILSSLKKQHMILFGKGDHIRDWIWVEDHVRGLILAAEKGKRGARYLFGGGLELSNLSVVRHVHHVLRINGWADFFNIEYQNQRPTDDEKYSIDYSKTTQELGWVPSGVGFTQRIQHTIEYYKKEIQND